MQLPTTEKLLAAFKAQGSLSNDWLLGSIDFQLAAASDVSHLMFYRAGCTVAGTSQAAVLSVPSLCAGSSSSSFRHDLFTSHTPSESCNDAIYGAKDTAHRQSQTSRPESEAVRAEPVRALDTAERATHPLLNSHTHHSKS